jgi:hypothetical protein
VTCAASIKRRQRAKSLQGRSAQADAGARQRCLIRRLAAGMHIVAQTVWD